MNRRQFLRNAGLLSAFGLVAPGCQYLPAIQGGVDSAQAIAGAMLSVVGTIETFVGDYFAKHPDPAKQAVVMKGIERAKQVIAVLFDILSTAKDAMALNVQKAIQDAQKAYADLLALTQPLGVTSDVRVSATRADGDLLVVPSPEHFAVSR